MLNAMIDALNIVIDAINAVVDLIDRCDNHCRRVGTIQVFVELCFFAIIASIIAFGIKDALGQGSAFYDSHESIVSSHVAPVKESFCMDLNIMKHSKSYASIHACEMSDDTTSMKSHISSNTLRTSVESDDHTLTVVVYDHTHSTLSRAYTLTGAHGNVIELKKTQDGYHELIFVISAK